jgi:hypothetical protein
LFNVGGLLDARGFSTKEEPIDWLTREISPSVKMTFKKDKGTMMDIFGSRKLLSEGHFASRLRVRSQITQSRTAPPGAIPRYSFSAPTFWSKETFRGISDPHGVFQAINTTDSLLRDRILWARMG